MYEYISLEWVEYASNLFFWIIPKWNISWHIKTSKYCKEVYIEFLTTDDPSLPDF